MRDFVESQDFQHDRSMLGGKIERWDTLMRALDWALCTNPEKTGQRIGDTDIWAVPSYGWPGMPAVVIYYRFDDHTVVLLSVIRADPSL
jgi:hypothetical protein